MPKYKCIVDIRVVYSGLSGTIYENYDRVVHNRYLEKLRSVK